VTDDNSIVKTKKYDIFKYTNYRSFLRDVYTFKRKGSSRFSFRIFSRLAGFKSPNFLKLIIDGERNLSLDGIYKVASALQLNTREKEYFEILVQFNQVQKSSEKNYYCKRLESFREFKKVQPLKKEQLDYFSKWYNVTIRELANTCDFRPDPVWVAKRLRPPIKIKDAHEALVLLKKLGLLKEMNGKFVQSNTHLSTDGEVDSVGVLNFHKEMILRGAEALDMPSDIRDVSSLTLAISEHQFNDLRQKIYQFYSQIQGWLESSKQPSDRVCQLNFQLFHLTQTNKEVV